VGEDEGNKGRLRVLSSFFKKLLMAKHLRFVEGDVAVFEITHVMHPASAHLHLAEQLEKKFGAGAQEAVYEAGKNTAAEVAKELYDKFKVKGLESVNLWRNIIELNGMAKVVSISPKEKGFATVVASSSIAKHKASKAGKGAKVDYFLAGFLAGIFSQIYDRELECKEVQCIVEGAANCSFEIKPK